MGMVVCRSTNSRSEAGRWVGPAVEPPGSIARWGAAFFLAIGACVPLLAGRDPHGERFQTSTSRQPCPVFPTTPPTSQPTLQARDTFAGTGIGPISFLWE